MRYFPLSLFLLSFILLTSSCTSSSDISCGTDKKVFTDNFYNFIDQVKTKQQKEEISDQDWVAYDKQFDKLTHECYQIFEKDLTTTDQMGIAASTCFYLYAKHGASVVTKLLQQDAIVREILSEINPLLLIKIATEVLNNPQELRNIIGDLEKRYQ